LPAYSTARRVARVKSTFCQPSVTFLGAAPIKLFHHQFGAEARRESAIIVVFHSLQLWPGAAHERKKKSKNSSAPLETLTQEELEELRLWLDEYAGPTPLDRRIEADLGGGPAWTKAVQSGARR